MLNRTLIEDLEDRVVLAAASISVGPNNVYFNAVQNKSATYVVRVHNDGDKRLVVSSVQFKGANPSAFKAVDVPEGGLKVNPGSTKYLTVRFTAPSGTTAIQTATLRLISNDPKRPQKNTPLFALPTKGEGGNLEPSLQKILNLYNLPIDSGATDAENYLYPTTPSSTSDEIVAQTFVKAGKGNVSVAPIAAFTNNATPNIRMGYYTPGILDSEKYVYAVDGQNGQTVNPEFYGQSTFDPGSATFGLVTEYSHFSNTDASVRNVYSEKALNQTWDSSSFNHFRVYPFKDQSGATVANTYLVAEEEYTAAYDNQDLVFLVTNVKPVSEGPKLSYSNTSGYPSNDILSFNRVQTADQYVANITRTSNTLKIRNSGTSPLTVSTAVTGDFSITSGAATNVSLAPGETRNIVVRFNATSGTDVHKGTLTLTTNDPDQASVPISLLGSWQQYSEQAGPGAPSVEPTAETIVERLLGYTTDIPIKSQLNNGGNITTKGPDEINAQYFTAADTNGAVRVTELAAYHSQTYLASDGTNKATNSHIGWWVKGSLSSTYRTIFTDKPGEGQMVLPTLSDGSTTAAGTFDAKGATFGFVVDRPSSGTPNTTTSQNGEYSDYSLNANPDNKSNFGQFLRFFIARDANGVVIPNAYIVLHDYNTNSVNYDFNDNIYLISNVVPEGQVKAPMLANASRVSDGVRLSFAGPVDGPRVLGFNIRRSTTPDGAYSLLNGTPLAREADILYTDETAAAGTTYYYAITTVTTGGKESGRVVVSA